MEAIGDLMTTHHKKTAADMTLIRDEIKGITDRLGKVEASSDSNTNQIMDLQVAIKDLQQKTLQQEIQMKTGTDKTISSSDELQTPYRRLNYRILSGNSSRNY
ncbi:Hypothetical predicted protein [Pelobates cultripes]|uniref:Uncharacterized protein n=1 Tax=Pelobates cultripes TaxID=61616 RepID=A0AAD1WRH5_PELCU|nr:Hypothetical predicted protein [Pelobates cultripes]